jgi:hypothetical protein
MIFSTFARWGFESDLFLPTVDWWDGNIVSRLFFLRVDKYYTYYYQNVLFFISTNR